MTVPNLQLHCSGTPLTGAPSEKVNAVFSALKRDEMLIDLVDVFRRSTLQSESHATAESEAPSESGARRAPPPREISTPGESMNAAGARIAAAAAAARIGTSRRGPRRRLKAATLPARDDAVNHPVTAYETSDAWEAK